MTQSNKNGRIQLEKHLEWVPLGKMRVSVQAQRKLNPSRVNQLAATFELEQIGNPTLSLRDHWFWIIDGQHRVEALRLLGFEDEQQIQCWVYKNLSEQDEAEMFLKLNDQLTVHVFSKFKVAVNAGRETESNINRIVLAADCVVSRDQVPGAISAVGTLTRVYKRGGDAVLSRALAIIRDAYGDAGLEAPVIDGIGHLCQRYNGVLEPATAVQRLSNSHGGVNGLLGRAEQIHQKTGNAKGQCIAAAAVEIINRGRGGKKIPDWWKDSE